MTAPLTFRQIGTPTKSASVDLNILVCGHEQEIAAKVNYIFIKGNEARCDEPPADDSIEILSIYAGAFDMADILDDASKDAISAEILDSVRPKGFWK